MKQEGWQQQEQRLDAEEEKNQEQMLQSPEDTDQVLWHCGKSEGTGVTVKNIPTHEIIPPVYFCIQKSVKNIPGVCLRVRQYVMGNMYDIL